MSTSLSDDESDVTRSQCVPIPDVGQLLALCASLLELSDEELTWLASRLRDPGANAPRAGDPAGLDTPLLKILLWAIVPFPQHTNLKPLMQVTQRLLALHAPGTRFCVAEFKATLDFLVAVQLLKGDYAATTGQLAAVRWSETLQQILKANLARFARWREAVYDAWVEVYCELVEAVDYCPYHPERLEYLDGEMAVLPRVIDYVAARIDDQEIYAARMLRLAKCTYYLYVRGYWAQANPSPHWLAARAADKLGLRTEEMLHTAYEVEWCIKRGEFAGVQDHLQRMECLAHELDQAPEPDLVGDALDDWQKQLAEARIIYWATVGYYLLEAFPQDSAWRARGINALTQAYQIGDGHESPHRFIAMYRKCLYNGARFDTRDEALTELPGFIAEAEQAHDIRIATSMRLLQAKILLGPLPLCLGEVLADEKGFRALLAEAQRGVAQVGDLTQQARLWHVWGLYYWQRGKYEKALKRLRRAAALYTQLNRRGLLAEVQEAIAEIESEPPVCK